MFVQSQLLQQDKRRQLQIAKNPKGVRNGADKSAQQFEVLLKGVNLSKSEKQVNLA
ncbi:MAG: hypothetical protein RMY34_10510 [Aulosira sp. DedQUE10]|nr:hypothetical protein [Aulosira sp. DedQUE10]